MVRKIVQKWRIIQIRKLAKNGGIVQIGGKCSENKINSKWGILQKIWGNLHMGDMNIQNGISKWGILNILRLGHLDPPGDILNC